MVTAIIKLFVREQQQTKNVCRTHQRWCRARNAYCTTHASFCLHNEGCHHPTRQGERRKVVMQGLCTKVYKWLSNCRHCVTRPCARFSVHVSPRSHNHLYYGTRPLKYTQECCRESFVDALCCLWALACQCYIAVIIKLLMHTSSSIHTCIGVIQVFFGLQSFRLTIPNVYGPFKFPNFKKIRYDVPPIWNSQDKAVHYDSVHEVYSIQCIWHKSILCDVPDLIMWISRHLWYRFPWLQTSKHICINATGLWATPCLKSTLHSMSNPMSHGPCFNKDAQVASTCCITALRSLINFRPTWPVWSISMIRIILINMQLQKQALLWWSAALKLRDNLRNHHSTCTAHAQHACSLSVHINCTRGRNNLKIHVTFPGFVFKVSVNDMIPGDGWDTASILDTAAAAI